jgi:hypothetical protein
MKTMTDAILILRDVAGQLEELLARKLEVPPAGLGVSEAMEKLRMVAGDELISVKFEVQQYAANDPFQVKWQIYDGSLPAPRDGQAKSIFIGHTLLQVVNACLDAHKPPPPITQAVADLDAAISPRVLIADV